LKGGADVGGKRSPSTLFRRMKVTELVVSLVDPDGFI
jgi:hypothetical protein